jgi:hypothetical protein
MVGSLFAAMRPRPLAPFAIVLIVAAALLAGCGAQQSTSDSTDKFQGQQRLVATAVEDLQSAATDENEDKICRDILSRALAGRLASAGNGCPAAIHTAIRDADTVDLTVSSVRVTGDRATAQVTSKTGQKDRRYALQLVRERGAWRIDSL